MLSEKKRQLLAVGKYLRTTYPLIKQGTVLLSTECFAVLYHVLILTLQNYAELLRLHLSIS